MSKVLSVDRICGECFENGKIRVSFVMMPDDLVKVHKHNGVLS